MESHSKRILIVNTDFNTKTGGGITIGNLFRGWAPDALANIMDGEKLSRNNDFSVCKRYYCLGTERKVYFPFAKKYKSGPVKVPNQNNNLNSDKIKGASLRKFAVDALFRLLKFFGLYNYIYKYEISDQLLSWIIEFGPDYIYTQCGTRAERQLTLKLSKKLDLPIVVHIMDDGVINEKEIGLFSFFWKKKNRKELENIFSRTKIFLSISQGMSVEYKKRYNREFFPFHNPIDINFWEAHSKKTYSIDLKDVRILYAGRVGQGMSSSILDFGIALQKFNNAHSGTSIKLCLLSPQETAYNKSTLKELYKLQNIEILPKVKYSELPKTFGQSDFLLLPVDFDSKGLHYLKYSMPTKASEYMISACPIILFCDPQVSLFDHACKNGWASVISENAYHKIEEVLNTLLSDETKRKELGQKAASFARANYNSSVIRKSFNSLFN